MGTEQNEGMLQRAGRADIEPENPATHEECLAAIHTNNAYLESLYGELAPRDERGLLPGDESPAFVRWHEEIKKTLARLDELEAIRKQRFPFSSDAREQYKRLEGEINDVEQKIGRKDQNKFWFEKRFPKLFRDEWRDERVQERESLRSLREEHLLAIKGNIDRYHEEALAIVEHWDTYTKQQDLFSSDTNAQVLTTDINTFINTCHVELVDGGYRAIDDSLAERAATINFFQYVLPEDYTISAHGVELENFYKRTRVPRFDMGLPKHDAIARADRLGKEQFVRMLMITKELIPREMRSRFPGERMRVQSVRASYVPVGIDTATKVNRAKGGNLLTKFGDWMELRGEAEDGTRLFYRIEFEINAIDMQTMLSEPEYEYAAFEVAKNAKRTGEGELTQSGEKEK